ncbi:hypothetical protein O3M35_007514 [Rhynocoris fuscipes]|uniref:Regulator of microtubule dynamics protein 1 n=1 Tax=Rhynocoris fuscipes TaxID=488301 RepID=A0AAW1D9P5_9HEMI
MQFLRRVFLQTIYRYKVNRPISVRNFGKYIFKLNKYNGSALLLSLGWFSQAKESEAEKSANIRKNLIDHVDELYKENKFKEVYDILIEHKDSNDVEILWRLSRVQYNISQEFSTPADMKKDLIFDAYKTICRSLSLDETHFANHKWMSILLDARSVYDGIKARISHLNKVKDHLLIAANLNPKDATTLYMLGLWCYQIADMPWYQRKIASAIFTAPPVSSFEEALEFFNKAEEVDPRFYSHNLLMLGKTYLKLKKEDKARYYLDLACNYPVSTDDDVLANKEACELLSQLKPKNIKI